MNVARDEIVGSVRDGREPALAAFTPIVDQPRRFSYRPALDGVRALAVFSVLLYHAEVSWLPGGFLGVDLFFVLSGYLITTLLLEEFRSKRAINLAQFWMRRLRRLGPALLVVLLIAALYGIFVVAGDEVGRVRGDIIGSVFYAANWRFIASNQGYWAQFSAPSPLQHMWSLAIEEQFYLVWPPLLLAGLILSRRLATRTWRLTWIAIAVAGSIGSALYMARLFDLNPSSSDAYYNTFARAQTLLIGVAVAFFLYKRDRVSRSLERSISVAAAVGLVGTLLMFVIAGGTARWMYHGGFLLASVFAALLVAGASRLAVSPVADLLAITPLPQIGLISYGLYVYHWPIFLFLNEDRTGLAGALLVSVRLLATLAAAIASYHLLERPIRERKFRGSQPLTLAGLSIAVLAFSLLLMPAANRNASSNFTQLLEDAKSRIQTSATTSPANALITDSIRVGTFGDSTALALEMGLGGSDRRVVKAGGYAELGCPVGRGGDRRGGSARGDVTNAPSGAVSASCDWSVHWPDAVRKANGLDVALVLIGNWDVGGRRIPELGNQWRTVGDPVYDKWLARELGAAADALHLAGSRTVVWLTLPHNADQPDNARIDRFNQLLRQTSTSRPWLKVADFAGYLAESGQDKKLRPDNIHLSEQGGAQVSNDWLNQVLIRAATEG